MKKLFFILTAVVMMVSTFALTSCGDDEPTNSFTYKAGITEAHGGSALIQEIREIDEIYFEALGTETDIFTLKGSEKDCTAKVVNACKKAEQKIDDLELTGGYTFTVTLLNNNKVVYKYSFGDL